MRFAAFRAWWMWQMRDPRDKFNPEWMAHLKALRAAAGDPYVGA